MPRLFSVVVLMLALLAAAYVIPALATPPGDNGRIVFRRYLGPDRTKGTLFTIAPDGSGERQLAKLPAGASDDHPDWSPDGAKIVVSLFTATAPGTGRAGIYTANADGSDLQQVTSSPTFDRGGDWGPHPLAT
jgi:hypothetical protein